MEDNLGVSNGRYVPNHRRDFRFGESTVGSKKEGAKVRHVHNIYSVCMLLERYLSLIDLLIYLQALQADLEASTWSSLRQLKRAPRVALVGHGMAADLKILDTMGIVIPVGEWLTLYHLAVNLSDMRSIFLTCRKYGT